LTSRVNETERERIAKEKENYKNERDKLIIKKDKFNDKLSYLRFNTLYYKLLITKQLRV
jgi:hypothetical protein